MARVIGRSLPLQALRRYTKRLLASLRFEEDQHLLTLCFFDAVDGSNARMVQVGKNLRLALEAGDPIRISRKRLGQDLQCHLPVQLGIGGLPTPGPCRPRR